MLKAWTDDQPLLQRLAIEAFEGGQIAKREIDLRDAAFDADAAHAALHAERQDTFGAEAEQRRIRIEARDHNGGIDGGAAGKLNADYSVEIEQEMGDARLQPRAHAGSLSRFRKRRRKRT